jgi:hypothetical protein
MTMHFILIKPKAALGKPEAAFGYRDRNGVGNLAVDLTPF